MLDFGFYNMDCMEGMKEFPDKYFDLAIVDPPCGDAGGAWSNGERFGQRFDRYRHNTEGGWHGKQKYKLSPSRKCGSMESQEPAGNGRRSTEKNHIVGRRPETGILRRTVSRLTKPDHLGGQLLCIAGNTLFFDLEKNECS